MVGFCRNRTPPGHDSFYSFIDKDGTDATPAGLFISDPFALAIIPGKVEAPDEGMFGSGSGGNNRYTTLLSFRKVIGEDIGHAV